MKFAVFTDLHYDAIPDGDRRIKEFVQVTKKEDVDFIIDLGDLCNPSDENKHILDELQEIGVNCYFVVGNHNSDEFSIDTVLKFFNLKQSWYSFIKGNIKFIVLDANYIKSSKGYKPYNKRNYNKTDDEYPYIPPEELDWLKNEISDDRYYYVILSHHSLANDFMKRGISNREEVRKILEAYILDRTYVEKLQIINKNYHGEFWGYGVAVKDLMNIMIDWNMNNTYIQSEGITQDFGVYNNPDELLKEHNQDMTKVKAFLFRNVDRHLMNRNVKNIRNYAI